MKATIYDVAKEAGVSIATVSNAINGKGKVSKKRREHIFKIMEELDYQPSLIASALMGKKTYSVGLLIPDISNPFFAEIARAIEDQAHTDDYSVIMCSTDNQDERVERYIALLEQKRVDGIVIGTGVDNTDILARLQTKNMPIVLIARETSALVVDTVLVDDFIGGMMAARHLTELGHRRLAILSENLRVSSSRERIRGFKQGLLEMQIPFDDHNVVICEHRVEEGRRGAAELLGRPDPPTAIFCCNDLLAIGAMQGAKQLGVKVPDQLSIVGFDDTILAQVTDPPLTTVAQPIATMGKQAFKLLIDNVQHAESTKRRIVLRPELRLRQSTAGPVDDGHEEV
ncbi:MULTISPECIES: LacI family DNA-binding transcriptional regulator [Paenibacillus]|uniref:LacI family DNA-binding transcriptional regulator n=1 Tax=Paenibacillus TaxID=44249 RepID=UPI0022B8FE5B|nr:LacI family DNA-binding transcriptional regulator [Paenibacillus caseinilyticus]MCZ8517938.1 LacI family DNA-binding transcriptional regulator [Paenibacillus caseinilyticus]